MNSNSLFHFAEWMALILVILTALGIAAWPRRMLAHRIHSMHGHFFRWLLAAAECLIFPVLALCLGWLL